MIKSLQKHEHKLVLTRTKPEVLLILSGIGCDLHIHNDGMDLEILLKGIRYPIIVEKYTSLYIQIVMIKSRFYRDYLANLNTYIASIFIGFQCQKQFWRLCRSSVDQFLRLILTNIYDKIIV